MVEESTRTNEVNSNLVSLMLCTSKCVKLSYAWTSDMEHMFSCMGSSFPSYVHTSTGTMPSLLLSGGNRYSSHRKCRGKWTRMPRMAFSSSAAASGSVSFRHAVVTCAERAAMLRMESEGRQWKTWRTEC